MREEMALRVDRGTQLDDGRVAWIPGGELVGVAHFGSDRSAGGFCDEITRVFVERRALATEIAADERAIDDDILLGDANRSRHLRTQGERRLVGGHDANDAVPFDPHGAGVRLDVAL